MEYLSLRDIRGQADFSPFADLDGVQVLDIQMIGRESQARSLRTARFWVLVRENGHDRFRTGGARHLTSVYPGLRAWLRKYLELLN